MTKEQKTFDYVSKMAFGVLIALLVFAIFTNSLIMLSPTLNSAEIGFPSSGTFAMLFDYSGNVGHSMRMLGQVLSNIVAYLFMLAAVVIVILSLALIHHNKKTKVKCAVLGAALIVPAVFGFTGGVIDFFAHGFKVLNTNKALDTGFIMAGVVITLILDVAFLILAIICLVKGIGTAIKINKGELTEDEKEVKEEKPVQPVIDTEDLLNKVRDIVKEELNKLDRIVIAREVRTTPKVENKPEPKVEPKPEPAPAPVEDEQKKLSIQRIPFADKIVKADKDLQEKYNELKSEFLAYGASSRVSVGGDTFRLHRKAYVKITIVGKMLKVYYALNPKDFADSTYPIVDASEKVAYEEVPTLLKVKSNLSVKRAKELAEQAFAKDGITKEGEPQAHNWVKDIKAELKAK